MKHIFEAVHQRPQLYTEIEIGIPYIVYFKGMVGDLVKDVGTMKGVRGVATEFRPKPERDGL